MADSDSESSRGRGFSKQIDGQKRRISEAGRKSVQSRDRATCAGNIEQSRQDVADSESERHRGGSSEERGDKQRIVFSQEQGRSSVGSEAEGRSSSCGKEFWTVEPNVGRVAHGVPRRVDRLKGLGNAIVPQLAMQIGLAIKEEIKKNE